MNNPLLAQDQLPQFDAIDVEHMEPAIDRILKENRARVAELAEQQAPTWESLAQPMQVLDDRLNNAWSILSHLNGVMNDEAIREVHKRCLQKITEYGSEISQNAALCETYKRLAESDEFPQLREDQQEAIRQTLRDFRLGGVDLPEAQKARFATLSQELADLESRFGDNVLDATQNWYRHVTDESELSGLPQTAMDSARQAAQQRGLDGWVITLDFPSFYPVLTYCDNRALRREVYEAFTTRASDQGPDAGRWDNSPLIDEILKRRHEQAQLLGYDNYAQLSLATKMAASEEEVLGFLNRLAGRARPVAERELEELREFARQQGGPEPLEAWDLGYYGEKLRHARFSISEEEVRPWFPVDRVISGLFRVVEKLFEVRIVADESIPAWHDDVTAYRMERGGEPVAFFYLDLYARQGKRGGAWMADCRVRWRHDDGSVQLPVAFLTCNFTPPVGDQPSLLTHDEVVTLFHEFGHGLHHMLTRVDVADVSGINGVAWDAVELPSQFLENWCWDRESLALIAGHHETGEPLPDDMLERMLAARNFQSGMQMVRQLEFSLFDFRLHSEYDPADPVDPLALLTEVRNQVAVVHPPAFNRFPQSFAHIFAGPYAAGYYSYKWAEVLAADAFSLFEEQGIFDPEAGRAFRENILEKGGSREPAALYRAFRGRDPSEEPLLRQSGITESDRAASAAGEPA
ncbi:oligopeptidase A [Halovibrio salipaludis]|uniref:oligopeptidase A n=1 Tax=Halovibrio salipaludis TaxID=2032626 RepID=A0A2A2FBA3_9GAMM|nr:M3 family metallopeptidase [Halovibrio salipaludis]PAU82004.1 oligopeptidase A [Halovibrio salipaludis]